MPAIGSDNDTDMICDICETFSFEHRFDIDTSGSRNIAIADIATFANMSLSPRDQLSKPGYSMHARDTSVRGMPEAMLRYGVRLSSRASVSNQYSMIE